MQSGGGRNRMRLNNTVFVSSSPTTCGVTAIGTVCSILHVADIPLGICKNFRENYRTSSNIRRKINKMRIARDTVGCTPVLFLFSTAFLVGGSCGNCDIKCVSVQVCKMCRKKKNISKVPSHAQMW